MDENTLILEAIRGSSVAYKELFLLHRSKIERIASAMTRNLPGADDAAKDVVQQTFIKGYRKLWSYKADGPFVAWLSSIAWNVALDAIREQNRRRERGLLVRRDDDIMEMDIPVGQAIDDEFEEAARSVSMEEDRQHRINVVRRIAEDLPPKLREMFDIFFLVDTKPTIKEVARMLNMTEAQVRGRKNKLYAAIRRKYEFHLKNK